jgi:uncharacterized membrane protein
VRFLAPGSAIVEVTAPGEYVLWHEYRTVFQGRTYRAAPALPSGVDMAVGGPGGAVPVGAGASQSWKDGDRARQAIGRFNAARAGTYTVSVQGAFEPRVMAVGREFLWRMLGSLGGALLIAFMSVGAAVGMAVYALGRRPAATKPAGASAGPASTQEGREKSLRELAMVVYALQAASLLNGVTLIAGVIVNYLKREEAAGTWLESHFRWQIRTFWWTLAWLLVGFATVLFLVGFVVWIAAAVWLIYRVVVGWIELRAGRPMDAD